MDEVIFEEFKGTGNMELVLDRKLADKRIFPAIDIKRSGTRREELLMSKEELDAIWAFRRSITQQNTADVMVMFLDALKKTKTNRDLIRGMGKMFQITD